MAHMRMCGQRRTLIRNIRSRETLTGKYENLVILHTHMAILYLHRYKLPMPVAKSHIHILYETQKLKSAFTNE